VRDIAQKHVGGWQSVDVIGATGLFPVTLQYALR